MAKRFTDTNKYKKPFIRSLPGPYKLLWDYLYHDCNHAGIWIVDFEIAQIYLGSDMKVDKKTALELFNADEEKVVVFDGGKKWFLPSFVSFQYGELSEKNRLHLSVITALKNENLLNENKPLTSPLQGAKEKDKVKEKDKDKEKVKKTREEKVTLPWEDQEFINAWETWKTYKKNELNFKYKSRDSEQAALIELANKSNGNMGIAIAIIRQSIANGWKGFFELTKNERTTKNGSITKASAGSNSGKSAFEIIAERAGVSTAGS